MSFHFSVTIGGRIIRFFLIDIYHKRIHMIVSIVYPKAPGSDTVFLLFVEINPQIETMVGVEAVIIAIADVG
jgi:hypothetical protein